MRRATEAGAFGELVRVAPGKLTSGGNGHQVQGAGDVAAVPGSAPAPTTGAESVQLLEQALRASKAFAPDVFRWLQRALREYAKEGRAGTLERHLGLNVEQNKGRSAVRRRLVNERWQALGAAYAAQIDCDNLGPFKRCDVLVTDLKEFEKLFWESWRQSGPPESASRLRRALFAVYQAYDGHPPCEARSLYGALVRAGTIISAAHSHEQAAHVSD